MNTGKILSIHDKPSFFDRFTVVLDDLWNEGLYGKTMLSCIGMNESPNHPQGFYQHSSCQKGKHLGKRIKFEQLPFECQKALVNEFGRE